PSPYPILLSLLKIKGTTKINRDNVFFVGDLPTDIQSAHNARVRSIAVTTGHGTAEELRQEAPDYLIRGVINLFAIPEFKQLRLQHNKRE
ncbi:MAG TPA: HAD hydrolase-like protein, partial [Candidatus Lokiarchaeia archaeon]|nr:HAD hydrolase-like protein [Candidatus Lokiarchaeia archaeon]